MVLSLQRHLTLLGSLFSTKLKDLCVTCMQN